MLYELVQNSAGVEQEGEKDAPRCSSLSMCKNKQTHKHIHVCYLFSLHGCFVFFLHANTYTHTHTLQRETLSTTRCFKG